MFNYQKLLNLFIEYIVFTARGCVYFEGIKTATIIGCQGIRYGPSGRILRPKNTTVRPKFRPRKSRGYPVFQVYACNCNPSCTLPEIYRLLLVCKPSLELFTWQEVINLLLDTLYIQKN